MSKVSSMYKPTTQRVHRKWLTSAGMLVACLAVSCAAYSAGSANWWIDIKNDRAGDIKTQLAAGANPNVVNEKGQPALMQAIRDAAWDTYDVLVAHRKIDVNAVNSTGETPLMYLALVGQTARAQALIKRGAQVNRLGWTPLHYAASTGHPETVRMLIANKAIVDAPSPDGTTPLMMAAYIGSEQVARLLLDAGAEVTTRNLQKQDAADWARLKKHDALAQKLDKLTQKTLAERSALHAKNRAQEAVDAAAGRAAESAEGSSAGDGAGTDALSVTTVDTTELPTPAVSPVVPKESAADKKPARSGSSRYFNLERFDEAPKN